MNKLLFIVSILVSGCTYQPYHYERYIINNGDSGQARIKAASSTFSINVSPTRYNPDLAKNPYTVYFNYVDSSMEVDQLAICNIVISTSNGSELHTSDGCKIINFQIPSLKEGVEPYAKSVSLTIKNINPDFQAKEHLIIKFSYTTNATGIGIPVKLRFNPVLDKGKFQPCCLPSV